MNPDPPLCPIHERPLVLGPGTETGIRNYTCPCKPCSICYARPPMIVTPITMKVTLYSHTGDAPVPAGSAWIDAESGEVRFSDLTTKELCNELALDADGPVTVAEPERFLRSLPRSISGSALRAVLEP